MQNIHILSVTGVRESFNNFKVCTEFVFFRYYYNIFITINFAVLKYQVTHFMERLFFFCSFFSLAYYFSRNIKTENINIIQPNTYAVKYLEEFKKCGFLTTQITLTQKKRKSLEWKKMEKGCYFYYL